MLPKQMVASSNLVSRSTRAFRTMKAGAVARTVLMFDGSGERTIAYSVSRVYNAIVVMMRSGGKRRFHAS